MNPRIAVAGGIALVLSAGCGASTARVESEPASSATSSVICNTPFAPPSLPAYKSPSAVCNTVPVTSSGKPPWTGPPSDSRGPAFYPPPGFFSGNDVPLTAVTKLLLPTNGWQGSYQGYELLIAGGSALDPDGSGSPTDVGAVAIARQEIQPTDPAQGLPVLVNVPQTRAPLTVTSVALPNATVSSPSGDTFQVNLLSGDVTTAPTPATSRP